MNYLHTLPPPVLWTVFIAVICVAIIVIAGLLANAPAAFECPVCGSFDVHPDRDFSVSNALDKLEANEVCWCCESCGGRWRE